MIRQIRFTALAVCLATLTLAAQPTLAQQAASVASPIPSRLTAPIDDATRVSLHGTIHPLARAANDRGLVPDSTPLKRMQIVLKKSDAQELAARQLIEDLHNPASPSFHKWLTPEQFGQKFGPSDADVATLSTWLSSKGFNVTKLNPGRQTLEFEGTAGQFRAAFQSEIHKYAIPGGTHFANNAEPKIPAALAPVFGGFASLNNFPSHSPAKINGKASYDPRTGKSKPSWTIGSAADGYSFVFAPGDFAVQYDTAPLLTAGTNGAGQTIAVINISNVDVYLVNQYRALFNLPASPLQVIIDGADPGLNGINNPDGQNGFLGEAYLDVEMTGMSAPGATIDLVIAGDTALSDGFGLASEHAVYNNLAPIMSLSVEACEQYLGSSNQFYNSLWQQAAAQGITVVVAASDSGSAGCDDFDTAEYATYGQQVNGFASTPYNVAVGGTDFYYSDYATGGSALGSQLATYWSFTPSNNTPVTSLKSTIPEQPWNDSQYGLDAFNEYDYYGTTNIVAGSGGASNCGIDTTTCAPYPKPSWQSGAGVPADHARDLPDISLFAANGDNFSYYPLCSSDGDCQPVSAGDTVQISGAGGTSASAPAFAGIMAIINQKYGRQGQVNYVLYPLATQYPAAFHDITVGTNTVPCALSGTNVTPLDCIAVANPATVQDSNGNPIVEGEIGTGTTAEYNAGPGYDLASGLGTIDANVMIADWTKVAFATTTTTLTPSSTSFAHGTTITVSGAVEGSATSVPTGQVALMTTSTTVTNQSETNFTLASGDFTGTLNYLPGGTYTIYGRYGGDTANTASSSTPVSITVTPETSATALELVSGGAVLASAAGISYGAPLSLEAIPAPTALVTDVVSCLTYGTSCTAYTVPTGSVTFTESGATLPSVPLTAAGEGFYNYFAAPGSHSVSAAYSGDASYGASTSPSATFSVTKDTPKLSAATNNSELGGGVQTVTFLVTNSNYAAANALPPTGTLSFTGGPSGFPASGALTSAIDPYSGSAEGVATVTLPASVIPGTYNVTYSYPGDSNYGPASTTYSLVIAAPTGSIPTTITATASAPAATPGTAVNITVTVTGTTAGGTPQGLLILYSDGQFYDDFDVANGTGDSVTTVISASYGLFTGGNVITVQFYPLDNYEPSETTVSVNNSAADFTLVPTSSAIVSPIGSATDTINLASSGSFAGPVNLTCAAGNGITCSLSSSSVTLAAGGTGTSSISLNTVAAVSGGIFTAIITGTDSTGQIIHTAAVTLNVTPSTFTLSDANSITIPSQGASGSTTITITPTGAFSGNVVLTCAVTSSPAGAIDPPACGLTTPVTVALGTTATATLSINTTAQSTSALVSKSGEWLAGMGTTLFTATLIFLLLPVRRRRLTTLALTLCVACVFGTAVGCGSSNSTGTKTGPSGGTTLGAYTVTVTGTDAATGKISATIPVKVTVN
jgi:trimeric autotransporter adhesin